MRPLGRREFLHGLTAAGTATVFSAHPALVFAEPPPETTTIKLQRSSAICFAPYYVAEDLLRGEGFTDVQYVKEELGATFQRQLRSGEVDFSVWAAPTLVLMVDKGDAVVGVTGLHVGCFELFAVGAVRSIRDLKGKRLAIPAMYGGAHLVLTSLLAHIGLDPQKDVEWVVRPGPEAMGLLAERKVDAFMGFPPEPQELRAKKIGHMVVNTTTDRPWSQYFCCMVVSNREFVRKHPVATKRVIRAILKANQICLLEPERVARLIVDKGYASQYEYALQTVKGLPFAEWRQYDPADALRFYALRLHEAGMIKSSPQRILTQGTDWRFLNELKKELKA